MTNSEHGEFASGQKTIIGRAVMTNDEALAHVAITHEYAKYFRALDRRQLDLLKSAFHPDATDDHGDGLFQGNAHEMCEWIIRNGVDLHMTRQHHLTNVYIEMDGDDFANGECYSIVVRSIKDPKTQQEVRQVAGARLLDRFERRDGEWKVLHRQVVVDWVGKSMKQEDCEDLDALKPFANGKFYPDDVSYTVFKH